MHESEEESSILTTVFGTGMKEKTSVTLYALSIPLSFVHTWLAFVAFLIVAVMWLVPDRRFAKADHSNAH